MLEYVGILIVTAQVVNKYPVAAVVFRYCPAATRRQRARFHFTGHARHIPAGHAVSSGEPFPCGGCVSWWGHANTAGWEKRGSPARYPRTSRNHTPMVSLSTIYSYKSSRSRARVGRAFHGGHAFPVVKRRDFRPSSSACALSPGERSVPLRDARQISHPPSAISVLPIVVFEEFAGFDFPPPPFVVAVPTDRPGDAFVPIHLGFPAELPEFCRVD